MLDRCGRRAQLVSDDTLTIYAQTRDATLVTHDIGFSPRRRRNTVGRHIFLRCNGWDAAALLTTHLDELVPLLESRADIFVLISHEGWWSSSSWA